MSSGGCPSDVYDINKNKDILQKVVLAQTPTWMWNAKVLKVQREVSAQWKTQGLMKMVSDSCVELKVLSMCRTQASSPDIWSMAHNYMATLHNAVPYKNQLQKRRYFHATLCNACKYISLNPPKMSSDVLPAFSELALEGNVSIWCRCHSETCNSLHLHLNSLRCSFT